MRESRLDWARVVWYKGGKKRKERKSLTLSWISYQLQATLDYSRLLLLLAWPTCKLKVAELKDCKQLALQAGPSSRGAADERKERTDIQCKLAESYYLPNNFRLAAAAAETQR